MLQKVKHIVPKLTNHMHKGQCGRIAVFGGCILYTGAPYFAAISALKCGADLVHVFCEKGAGTVIKGYSPELIVHPVLDTEYGIEEIDQWLPRLHVVVLGPGLGRNQSMLGRISLIMDKARGLNIPIVLDADGLWHLATNPGMLKGYTKAVITPNAMEFSRLVKSVLNRDVAPSVNPDPKLVEELAQGLGNLTVIHKGASDLISNGVFTEDCASAGSPRRCGGQGDLLSGTLATFLHWASLCEPVCPDPGPGVVAAWGAARLARGCAEQAYMQCGRSVTTTDMIGLIHQEFSRLYESETFL
jgi:ATP-dependent NAD(P)H-hydrate dehydratase